MVFSNINAGLFSNYFDLIFHQYSLKKKRHSHLIDNIEAPWVIFNSILKKADFKYFIEYVESSDDFYLPEVILIDRDNGNRLDINQLSSGEKTIMSLIITLYNSQNGVVFPELLVLDEPDAYLHPSMAKQFLNVINEVLVKENGVKVILSTHSPSTVALAPEDSIFIMDRNLGYLVKGDKNEAIRTLTSGLATFNVTYEHRKQIFTEDKIDEYFYQNLFHKLVYEDLIEKDLLLQFISIGLGQSNTEGGASGSGGCTLVKKFTKELNENGNLSVFGLIDWDKSNKEEGRVIVLGNNKRYCLENYLYDPLFILCSASIISYDRLQDLGLDKFVETHDIKSFKQEKLQNLVDGLFVKIKPNVEFRDIDSKSDDLIEVKLYNGLTLQYPSWFLLSGGHRIKDACLKAFPFVNRLGKDSDYVSRVVIKNYWFLAQEVIDTLLRLQSMPIH
ncbi:ATP-dependent endonuclease [Siphonobacter sp. SORGH_AS_0500]|uniref:ATP-dependent nuclease n=1 Tax=Siphonobacter sp. SORGH_AS_0500 TaxID=1864824 RepID=UPI0012FF5542|nr:AAA family ATPase [Siphonobacter sp. SORGH_AS_0500]